MSSENENAVEVRNLTMKFGQRTIFQDISFDIKKGEIFVILGGSGVGKSTLLRALVGLETPYSGSIMIGGVETSSLSEDERIALHKRMGMCFQGSAMFNSMTVGQNVALPLREHTKLEASTIDIMVKIKLELVGLSGFEDYMPSQLSGGMKKRAGLARAMAMDPELIFYDEPSAGLDPIVAVGLDLLIRKMQHTFTNLTSIVVTHELPSVELIADRVCLLGDGGIVQIGTLKELKTSEDPYVRQFFDRKPSEDAGDQESYLHSLQSHKD